MNPRNTTNVLLAFIAGLLIALVASPASNSAPKSPKVYDAVQLADYEACLTYAVLGYGWFPKVVSQEEFSNFYLNLARTLTGGTASTPPTRTSPWTQKLYWGEKTNDVPISNSAASPTTGWIEAPQACSKYRPK